MSKDDLETQSMNEFFGKYKDYSENVETKTQKQTEKSTKDTQNLIKLYKLKGKSYE